MTRWRGTGGSGSRDTPDSAAPDVTIAKRLQRTCSSLTHQLYAGLQSALSNTHLAPAVAAAPEHISRILPTAHQLLAEEVQAKFPAFVGLGPADCCILMSQMSANAM